MRNCTFTYNGTEPIFGINPGEQFAYLDFYDRIFDYVLNNPNSNDVLVKAFRAKLYSADSDIVAKFKAMNSAGAKLTTENSVGVSSSIEHKWEFLDSRFVPEYSQPDRIEHMKPLQSLSEALRQYIIKTIANNSKPKGADVEPIIEQVKQQLKEEAEIAPYGEYIHGIIQYLFEKKGNTDCKEILDLLQKMVEDIGSKEHPGKIYDVCIGKSLITDPSKMKEYALKIATDVYNAVKAKFGEDAEYLTETWVSVNASKLTPEAAAELKNASIRGRLDLVVIKDGKINIVDFKTSSRSYDDWFAAKRYHTEYQLGMYRAMVGANGFDERQIGLFCVPIYIPYGKMEQATIHSNNGTPIKDMLLSSITHDHLSALDGKFTANIHKIIESTIPDNIDELAPEITEIVDLVNKVLDPFEQQRQIASKEVLQEYIKEGGDGKHKYYMWDFSKGEMMYADSKEEFTKEGGLIDLYIDRMKRRNSSIINDLVKQLEAFSQQENKTLTDVFDFLNSKEENRNVNDVLNKNLGRYLNGNWVRIPSEKLQALGIIAFQHINEPHDIEFVQLTNFPLTPTLKTGLGETVLGKFFKNADLEQQYPNLLIMESTVGNLFLMKMAAIINSMPELFSKGLHIGRMVVINYTRGESEFADIEQLQENFKIAASKGGLENHFSSLQGPNLWESVVTELNQIIRPSVTAEQDKAEGRFSWDNGIKKLVSELSAEENNEAEIIATINKLMLMMRKKYGNQVIRENVEEKWQEATEPLIIYGILASTLTYYTDTSVRTHGKINKWGLSLKEGLRYLTTPFSGGETYRDSKGNEYVGLGQGTYMSSPTTVVSDNLQRLYEHFTEAFLAVRKNFNKQAQYVTQITKEFEDKQVSRLRRVGLGYVDDIWSDLIVKENDGKTYSQNFAVKNPFDEHIDLDEDQKKFLKRILWEINKYILGCDDLKSLHWDGNENRILENERVKKAIQDGSYFNIPLRRARSFQEIKNIDKIGVLDFFSKKWEHLQDEIDDRRLNSTIREESDRQLNKDFVSLANPYELQNNKNMRQRMLEEQGVYDYEIDLNLIALDVAYNFIKQEKFVPLLLTADAFSIQAQQIAARTGQDFSTELDALHKYIDSVVLGKSIIDPELHGVSKTVSTLRRVNSFMHLAGRPLQLVKEMTVGTFTNFSRAWANSGREGKFQMKSLLKGYEIVFGTGIHKFGSSVIGSSDFADFTMIQQLNHEYGMANDDMNTMVIKRKFNRHGLIAGASNMLYLANTAPDFYNRMVLFIAQMDHDGCFEAHTLDDDGNLHYDFSKDSRFSKLKCTGTDVEPKDGNKNDKEYLEQKALYRAMMEEFIKSDTKAEDGSILKFGMELPRAYTVSQRQSIKELANLAYGFYDHEEKSLMDNMFIGLIWKQFMTFWSAKLTLWGKGRNKYTAQGRFNKKTDENGNVLYFHIIKGADGSIIGTEEVTYSTDEEGNELEPVMEWEGEYTEGLLYSIGYTLKSVLHGDIKEVWTNKQRLGNLKLAMHDLLLGLVLLNILKYFFTGGTGDTRDVDPTWLPAYMTTYRALQEFDPVNSLFSMNWEPSFYSTLTKVKGDSIRMLSGDKTIQQVLLRNFGALSDWTARTRYREEE